MDYLQQTNQELEDRIGELDVGKQTALDENIKLKVDMDKLHQELKDIDLLAQQLEREKQVGDINECHKLIVLYFYILNGNHCDFLYLWLN